LAPNRRPLPSPWSSRPTGPRSPIRASWFPSAASRWKTDCSSTIRKGKTFSTCRKATCATAGPAAASGFGDLALGVKQQLGPLAGFNLSAIVFLSFPTGASGISSHGYDPGVQLPWSRQLSTNWTLAGQVAFYWPTEGAERNFTGETTFYFDRQLSKPWDAFVEYAGDFPEGGGTRQQLHFGTAYKLRPHHQIDFHFAFGLSSAAPRAYVGFGYSFLFLSE